MVERRQTLVLSAISANAENLSARAAARNTYVHRVKRRQTRTFFAISANPKGLAACARSAISANAEALPARAGARNTSSIRRVERRETRAFSTKPAGREHPSAGADRASGPDIAPGACGVEARNPPRARLPL